MSTYGWTIEQVDDLTFLQTLALMEEIRGKNNTPVWRPSTRTDHQIESVLAAMPEGTVQDRSTHPSFFSRTGSRIVRIEKRRTGERVI